MILFYAKGNKKQRVAVMVDISAWMSEFLQKLSAAFGERVWFVGLQGSYSRGEAVPESDIDVVVILDELSAKDIQIYNAVNEAISLGACNIYHSCVHNMLHEKSDDVLRALYKAAFFVAQAIVFKQSGSYVKHLAELLKTAQSDEREIISTFLRLKNSKAIEFTPMAEALFSWSKKWIC